MNFIDPHLKQPLYKDIMGNLNLVDDPETAKYKHYDGVYDFTSISLEKVAYDKKYGSAEIKIPSKNAVREIWHDDIKPFLKILLNSLGDITGKKILLLGNGTSFKELYFKNIGAKITFTDLSIQAVLSMKKSVKESSLKDELNDIQYHAVNALYLPFENESFDIIYGYAFVHHIDNLDLLFSEIYRCLKIGGKCRFLDNSYSPIWQFGKKVILKPLFNYRLRKRFVSPEDLRFTLQGGFKEETIIDIKRKVGFKKALFIRNSLFLYLFLRALSLLTFCNAKLLKKANPLMVVLKKFDDITSKINIIKNNQLILIWGFDK